jgi:hypothetical protein
MAPDPADIPDPENSYVATRLLPNGREPVLAIQSISDWTQEQVIRAAAFLAARQNRTNNPAWRIFIYGPSNGGPITDDDRIWDSATDL